jgi:hypothetical protein
MPASLPSVDHPQPITVFRVIRHRIVFGKSERGRLDLRTLMRWNAELPLTAYSDGEACIVPGTPFEAPQRSRPCALLFSSEIVPGLPVAPEHAWAVPASTHRAGEVLAFPRASPIRMVPFQFTDGNTAEVHLRYDHMNIGSPSRSDFRLASLGPGQTVEVRINGKLDNSMSSGRARTYLEQAFLITWLGRFSRFLLRPEGLSHEMRPAPRVDKRVDLRKPLW